jgi:hypothetical protein
LVFLREKVGRVDPPANEEGAFFEGEVAGGGLIWHVRTVYDGPETDAIVLGSLVIVALIDFLTTDFVVEHELSIAIVPSVFHQPQ